MMILRPLLNQLKMSYCTKLQFRRLLMCDETLGLKRFRKSCQKMQGKLFALNENLFRNIDEIKDEDIGSRVIDMIYVAQNDDQVKQCVQLYKRYLSTNNKMTNEKGSNKDNPYQFGPLFMRMLHNLQKKDIAIQLMEDKELMEDLHKPTASLIYMDMLYKAGLYAKVMEFYEESFLDLFNKARKEKLRVGMKLFDMNHTTLVMAALYKMNTSESLSKAVELVREKHHNENESLSNRTRAYAAALALKQESPAIALDILNLESEGQMPVFNISLKIIILSHLDRPDQAMSLLEFFTLDRVEEREMFVCPDCLEALNDSITRSGCNELRKTYEEYLKHFRKKSVIRSKTLFDNLDGIMYNSPKGARRYRYKRLDDNVSGRDNTIIKKKTDNDERFKTRQSIHQIRRLRFQLLDIKQTTQVKKLPSLMPKVPSLKDSS